MADPDYTERYGIEVVDSNIINIHGTLEIEEVPEIQQMVIGTNSMNGDDWVKARYFAYMVGFLYFNKLFQIPLTIAHAIFGADYRVLFNAFLEFDPNSSSVLTKVQKQFYQHAKDMQLGGPEFSPSKKWLNIYWPPDELAFIEIVTSDQTEEFYEDAKLVLCEALKNNGVRDHEMIIEQSVELNKGLIKLPNQNSDTVISLDSNIWEVYDNVMKGKEFNFYSGQYEHIIDKTSETWKTWADWCEKVVWWCNKKGAYLYDCSLTKENPSSLSGTDREPFGNDVRYQ
jgi:hypothetical protein